MQARVCKVDDAHGLCGRVNQNVSCPDRTMHNVVLGVEGRELVGDSVSICHAVSRYLVGQKLDGLRGNQQRERVS